MLSACQRSAAVDAALHHDLPGLRRSIAQEGRTAGFSHEGLVELARAILEREMASARGEPGRQRVRSMRACAAPLVSALEARASGDDEVAAEATLTLLELGRLDREKLALRHGEARDPAWRAVGARAATLPEFLAYRHRGAEDPDARVRRAALEASFFAKDTRDFDILVDRMRRDPDPLSQSLAVRALGALGGERVVLALTDRWPTAGEPLVFSVLDAWAMPEVFAVGGERELVRVMETGSGLPKAAASRALVRISRTHREPARQILLTLIRDGSSAERLLAMRALPDQQADVLAALKKIDRAEDLDVRVLALARLARTPAYKKEALAGLLAVAKQSEPEALEARVALAALGDERVVLGLVKGLRAPQAFERQASALALTELGRYADAARALGDDDPEVRVNVACSLVNAGES